MTAERRKLILAMRQLWIAKREVYRAIAEVEAKLYPQPPALLRKQAN